VAGRPHGAERDWGAARHPIGRVGTVATVAAAALYLASGDFAFMTGADLLVDGGHAAMSSTGSRT
jgi:NAD(P)-dependent dehydrogenase (short-subunit alcohol dehydrogenase family)